DTSSIEIHTLSLHDALPIWCSATNHNTILNIEIPHFASSHHTSISCRLKSSSFNPFSLAFCSMYSKRFLNFLLVDSNASSGLMPDRKSTRLNSSHVKISYAV